MAELPARVSKAARKRTFLAALRKGASVAAAARAAEVRRQQPYEWAAADPTFAERWQDAIEEGTDRLEDRAHELALEGDRHLLMFLLKARRRQYRDSVTVRGDPDEPQRFVMQLTLPTLPPAVEGDA